MATTQRRSRSISTRSNRPASSASTASAQSLEQFQQLASQRPQHHQHPQSHGYGPQHFNHYHHLQPAVQPALVQAVAHVSQQENVSQDPIHQLVGYEPNNSAITSSSVPTSSSFHSGLPLQSLDPNMQQPQHHMQHHHQYSASVATSAASVEPEEKRKKGGAAGNATNDKELREMLKRNDGRRLNDVAAEVIATDRTSRAEKSKQLFAMLW
jgi:regulatory factor X